MWITGSRRSLYRELSCDKPVIRSHRGTDLVSALARLANPERAFLLPATASSFVSHRLARLSAQPPAMKGAADARLAAAFGAAVGGGVLETVAHTACSYLTN